jgi:hypothetical protein
MEVTVSKGFLVYAQNTDSVDYITQAYALALSIKTTQSIYRNISIVTDDTVPEEYLEVFDKVISIPWGDQSNGSKFKSENRWKLYHATPYQETIVLDTDMLLLEDITEWWTYCSNYNLKFCSRIKNYKLEEVVDTIHRKAFIANNLTSPYFALHYFKKSDEAHNFYKVLEFISNNWEWVYTKFAPEHYQSWASMDLTAAVAIEITGYHEQAIDQVSPLEFVHMKAPLQGWTVSAESWTNTVSHVLTTKGDLIVGNIKQSKLFHYVEKNFVTPQLIKRLKGLLNAKA